MQLTVRNHMRELRQCRRIRVAAMADDLRISASMIYSLERDPITPNLELAYRIAHYFDLAVEQVFEPIYADRRGPVKAVAN